MQSFLGESQSPFKNWFFFWQQHINTQFITYAYFVHAVVKEEKAKAYRKEKQKEKKRKAEEDLNFEDDDEMAAVMGFSGFGASKKGNWSLILNVCSPRPSLNRYPWTVWTFERTSLLFYRTIQLFITHSVKYLWFNTCGGKPVFVPLSSFSINSSI